MATPAVSSVTAPATPKRTSTRVRPPGRASAASTGCHTRRRHRPGPAGHAEPGSRRGAGVEPADHQGHPPGRRHGQRAPGAPPPSRPGGHLGQELRDVGCPRQQEQRAGVGDDLHQLPHGAVRCRLGAVGREPLDGPPRHPQRAGGPALGVLVGQALEQQASAGHGDPARVGLAGVGVHEEDLVAPAAVRRLPVSGCHRWVCGPSSSGRARGATSRCRVQVPCARAHPPAGRLDQEVPATAADKARPVL